MSRTSLGGRKGEGAPANIFGNNYRVREYLNVEDGIE